MSVAQWVVQDAQPVTQSGSLNVRLATWRDWIKICRMECACFGRARLINGLWSRVGEYGVTTWIAEAGNKPAGYLIAYKKELDGKDVQYVGGVGVMPSHRKSGIGTLLMHAVMADHHPVWLHVRANNVAAIRLYWKLGLLELRRIARFYSNGDDALVMATLDLIRDHEEGHG